MKNFKDKVVVITGAGSGIGLSTARAFAKKGAVLYITDIKKERITKAAEEIASLGASVFPFVVDSSNCEEMKKFADDVFKSAGRVDILHNNAGISVGSPVENISLDDWERLMNVNLWGTVYGIYFFLPRIIEQGREAHIINTASAAGLTALPSLAAYSATKAAIVALSEVMNIELRKYGIYTTALCPGIINTNIVSETKIELYGSDGKSRKDDIVKFYREKGTSPDKVARDVLKAVRRRSPVKTSPAFHVYPPWILKRISVSLYQFIMSRGLKILGI